MGGRDGFLFSSDSRFSGDSTFRSTPVLNREAKTDAGGSAQLTLDPTIEPTAQPRQYLVEGTVTGDDDQQVRGVQRITALPPFVLGVKVPRYVDKLGALDPEVVALDGEGHEVSGLAMTVRLIHRQWNSVLEASDFAQGSAKYQTQVLDETVAERQVTSASASQPVHFGVDQAGVYLVEVTAADKVGRTQTVRVDLFMARRHACDVAAPARRYRHRQHRQGKIRSGRDRDAGDPEPVPDRPRTSPSSSNRRAASPTIGWTSPMASAATPCRSASSRCRVWPCISWSCAGGSRCRSRRMRRSTRASPPRWRRPSGSTVNPTDNRVTVSFDAPAEARPAQEFDLVLHMTDAHGRPAAGEATVWMVDQAVLSLAKEAPLDPLPAFIVNRASTMAARDTRNMAFGVIPLQENAGWRRGGRFRHGEHLRAQELHPPSRCMSRA